MRRDLFITFLGLWVASVPFLPISYGTTRTAILLVTGLLVAFLAFTSIRK